MTRTTNPDSVTLSQDAVQQDAERSEQEGQSPVAPARRQALGTTLAALLREPKPVAKVLLPPQPSPAPGGQGTPPEDAPNAQGAPPVPPPGAVGTVGRLWVYLDYRAPWRTTRGGYEPTRVLYSLDARGGRLYWPAEAVTYLAPWDDLIGHAAKPSAGCDPIRQENLAGGAETHAAGGRQPLVSTRISERERSAEGTGSVRAHSAGTPVAQDATGPDVKADS